jgi:hypothetical protein
MLQYLHLSHRFIKQLRALEKSDKKGILAAGQAELIIGHYRISGEETEETRAKRTKHGESRLKNCLKYDLGGGYRLITLREGEQLLFACIGSHDETDLWLERNRGTCFADELQLGPFETVDLRERVAKEVDSVADTDHGLDGGDHYEEDLLRRIDEKTLRQVFSSFYNL